MTNYALKIRDANKQAHIDIEQDIQERRNGLFTFTLRVSGGNIADYNVTEYVNARERYLSLESVSIAELTVASNYRAGDQGNALRPDYLHHAARKRQSDD